MLFREVAYLTLLIWVEKINNIFHAPVDCFPFSCDCWPKSKLDFGVLKESTE